MRQMKRASHLVRPSLSLHLLQLSRDIWRTREPTVSMRNQEFIPVPSETVFQAAITSTPTTPPVLSTISPSLPYWIPFILGMKSRINPSAHPRLKPLRTYKKITPLVTAARFATRLSIT